MAFKEINSGVRLASQSTRRLLLALESMGIRPDLAKTFAMQVNKAIALGVSLLSLSSSAASSGSASTSTSVSPSASTSASPSGQVQTGVYDSSTTPSYLPWNTYNYCNAPHVNAEHYTSERLRSSAGRLRDVAHRCSQCRRMKVPRWCT